jgi:hypothetical protein
MNQEDTAYSTFRNPEASATLPFIVVNFDGWSPKGGRSEQVGVIASWMSPTLDFFARRLGIISIQEPNADDPAHAVSLDSAAVAHAANLLIDRKLGPNVMKVGSLSDSASTACKASRMLAPEELFFGPTCASHDAQSAGRDAMMYDYKVEKVERHFLGSRGSHSVKMGKSRKDVELNSEDFDDRLSVLLCLTAAECAVKDIYGPQTSRPIVRSELERFFNTISSLPRSDLIDRQLKLIAPSRNKPGKHVIRGLSLPCVGLEGEGGASLTVASVLRFVGTLACALRLDSLPLLHCDTRSWRKIRQILPSAHCLMLSFHGHEA